MKPYFYTFNRQHGIPTVKHESLQIAQGEAERLAAKQPGEAFEILRCVGIAQTSKASTFWVDGEEPQETARYRRLEIGEPIEEGDEWQSGSGQWLRRIGGFGILFDKHHNPHRRPLTDEAAPPEKPLYRDMMSGEWTTPSDEYESPRNSGIWKPVDFAPYVLCEANSPHRRPL